MSRDLIVNFNYDREKDALNWVNTIKDVNPSFGISYEDETSLIPDELKKNVLKSERKDAINLVLKYFESNNRHKLKELFILRDIKALKDLWDKKGNELINILEELTKCHLPKKTIVVYLTTLFISDYNYDESYFYLSLYHSLPMKWTIIAHELLHFIYYNNFTTPQNRNLKMQQDIKEALTVLLNTKLFKDTLLVEDFGYNNHEVLRNKIIKLYNENFSFKQIINTIESESTG